MITFVITVQAGASENVAINHQVIGQGTELEQNIARIMDRGLRAAQEYVTLELAKLGGDTTKGVILEGENIDKFVNRKVAEEMGLVNWKQILSDAGYKV